MDSARAWPPRTDGGSSRHGVTKGASVSPLVSTRNSPARLDRGGKLGRAARVRRQWEFSEIHRKGVRVQTRHFTVLGLATVADEGAWAARIGMAVSRKVGNAVVRNRIRRLIREVFRRLREQLPPADLVVIAKPQAKLMAEGGLEAVSSELAGALADAAAKAVERKGEKE